MTKKRKILIFSPHPDDETLGCSGFLLKLKKEGHQLSWVIFTEISEDGGWQKQHIKRKKSQIKKITNEYSFNNVFEFGYAPGTLDKVPISEIIFKIKKVLSKLKPELILLPHHADIHTDHQVSHQAIMSSSKNFRNKFIKTILAYETLSETEFSAPIPENAFLPNYYVDITKNMKKKLEIMKVYSEEVMKDPYPRSISSIRALARLRGSRVGVKYAEAYMLILNLQ